MQSLFKLFETISPSGYQYKDKKSYHPFWMQEGGSEVTSYNDLTDLPKIGGVEVKGNKSLSTYHLYSKDEVNSLLEGYITPAQLAERLTSKADLIQSVTYDGNQLKYYDPTTQHYQNVPTLKTFVFEIPDSDFTAVGLPSVYALNTEGIVLGFSLTKDSTRYIGEAGGAKRVYGSQNKLFSYCYNYNSINYLVVMSSVDLTGFTPSILSIINYPHMESRGTLSSALDIPFDTTKEGHLVDITVTLQRRYPDGTISGTTTSILSYLFILSPSGIVVPIVIDAHYNLRIGSSSYTPGTFTITSIPSNNSYDITQDSVLEAVSATATVVEEW